MRPNRVHEPPELRRGERRGRAAADIKRAHAASGGSQQPPDRLKLADQRVEILRQQPGGLLGAGADEAAIDAARRAERNADIDRHVVRLEPLHGLGRGKAGLDAEPTPRRADVIALPEQAVGVRGRSAAQQAAGGQLRRAHAGKASPLRRVAELHGRVIIGVLQQATPGRDVCPVGAQTARRAGGFPVQRQLGRRRQPRFADVQRRDCAVAREGRVDRLHRLVRKEGELQLFHSVAVVMTAQK